MKQHLGGVLVAALGAVLLGSGLGGGSGGSGGVIGSAGVTCDNGAAAGYTYSCPSAQFVFTDSDANVPIPPADWTVTIASANCPITLVGGVDVVTVPDKGTADSDSLQVYEASDDTTTCSYTFTETPVAHVTAVFDPNGGPLDHQFNQMTVEYEGINTPVSLTNTGSGLTSPTPTPSKTSVTPTPTKTSVSPTKASTTVAATVAATSASAAPTLPFTGARAPVRPLVIVGIGLLALGALLVGNAEWMRRRRPRRH